MFLFRPDIPRLDGSREGLNTPEHGRPGDATVELGRWGREPAYDHATVVLLLRAVALFALLAALLTWPQARHLTTHAADHQDVYFNMWRFAWVAHALSSPDGLFDGNVFHPEARVLTFSDALIVEALIASPLRWVGLPPVLVHNLLLLGGIVLSGAFAFLLARHLTGSAAGGVVAGLIFAFAPYRFAHYMHMELQWAVWVPLAFLALDRAVVTGRRRYGVLTGLCVALQFMSSIYYGVFLATLLGLAAFLLLLARPALWKRAAVGLALGALAGAALCAPYARPYLETRQEVGGRGEGEIATYSARPSDYLAATSGNYLYGRPPGPRYQPERRLFPGTLATILALTALLVSRPSVTVLVYLLALVAAFEMSLGVDSYAYGVLRDYIPGVNSLRAPARLGLFVLFFLGMLAAYGYAALERAMRPRWRSVAAVGVCAAIALEYWVVPLRLVAYPNQPPPLYAWLAGQPRGVVAEFPMPAADALPGGDPRFAYLSTFHWMPTVNGYSGFYPHSYLDRLARVAGFPDEAATRRLWSDGVRYVIVHPGIYPDGEGETILEAVASNPAYVRLGAFDGGRGDATVFRLQ